MTPLTPAQTDWVAGGLSAVSALSISSVRLLGPILEGGCPACRSGTPRDVLMRDELINPAVLGAGLSVGAR